MVGVFDCRHCGQPLGTVLADSGECTYLYVSPTVKLRSGTLECACGSSRTFHSRLTRLIDKTITTALSSV